MTQEARIEAAAREAWDAYANFNDIDAAFDDLAVAHKDEWRFVARHALAAADAVTTLPGTMAKWLACDVAWMHGRYHPLDVEFEDCEAMACRHACRILADVQENADG